MIINITYKNDIKFCYDQVDTTDIKVGPTWYQVVTEKRGEKIKNKKKYERKKETKKEVVFPKNEFFRNADTNSHMQDLDARQSDLMEM